MKKFFGLLTIFLFTTSIALAEDMRFIQVESALYSNASSKKFENMIEKINEEKGVEFVVFTGNNIAKPDRVELKNFLKSAKKLKRPFYIIIGQKDVNKKKYLGKQEYMKIVRKNVRSHRFINSPSYVFKKME